MSDDRLYPQQLHYQFEQVLLAKMRSRRIPRVRQLLNELIPALMEEVPQGAFEPPQSFEHGVLFFNDDVAEEPVKEVQDWLMTTHLGLKKDIPITLMLNSYGGRCDLGFAVASTIHHIQRAGRAVNIHVQGSAMSMGSVILQAGTRRTMESYAMLMLHQAASDAGWQKSPSIRDDLTYFDKLEHALCRFYAVRSGKPVEYWKRKWDRREWYLTAEEALAEGLVDAITPMPSHRKRPRPRPTSAPG